MPTSSTIAASGYEGWVAWMPSGPVFEKSDFATGLTPVATGAPADIIRRGDNRTKDWYELEANMIERLELYFAREQFSDQPAFRADREPGASNTRFIQLKMGGIVVRTFPGGGRDALSASREITRGQERLGVSGYKVGYWVPERNECHMWQFLRNSVTDLGVRDNPTSDPPLGFGLIARTMGVEP